MTKLDDLDGREDECVEDFKHALGLDAATDAIPHTFEENLNIVREVTASIREDFERTPIVSIPDKLYAAARAEGYEAGMRDAASIASKYNIPGIYVGMLLRDPVRRAKVLEMMQ